MEVGQSSSDSVAGEENRLRALLDMFDREQAEMLELQSSLENVKLEAEELRQLAIAREIEVSRQAEITSHLFSGLQSRLDEAVKALEATRTATKKPWKPEELIPVTSLKERTRFFAEKVLEQLNADYQGADFVIEEPRMSNVFLSRGKPFVHLNFTAKHTDGTVHFLFGETTTDEYYSDHPKGCGGCDPESDVPIFHPLEGFKHGNDYLYQAGFTYTLDMLADRIRYV